MASAEAHRRAMALFQEALDLPPEEREPWLEARTGDDAELRSDVLGLLDAHEVSGGVLDRPAPSAADVIIGTLRSELGSQYEIVGEIGRGGMAYVFLAVDLKHDRRVAVKVMRPEIAQVYGSGRFAQEVRLAAKLNHPHILGLIDSGAADGLLYYVMPYVEGETLRERLDRSGALPLTTAVDFMKATARALEHAHGLGVVHRDLKPGNVLCSGDHPYLMDFGVAKSLSGPTSLADEDGEGDLTQTGLALGTPRYMAPEQALGGVPVDHRADLYAWGLLAYEMLSGERAESSGSGLGPDALARLQKARPEIPPALLTLVERSLVPNPRGRIESATAILEEIRTCRFGPEAPPTPRLGRWSLALAGLAALVAAVVLWPGDPEPGLATLPVPVAVAPFVNETGDEDLTAVGRLAGDWIAQGLQQLGTVPVLPWPASLAAAERARQGDLDLADDPAAYLARELGAGTVITGSIYRVGDALHFAATVTDATRGLVVSAPEPIRTEAGGIQDAIRELRNRIMGSLAISADERLSLLPDLAQVPPTFDAYREFDRGIQFFLAQEYDQASTLFNLAFQKDTTFLVSRVYEARSLYNETRWNDVDEVLAFLRMRRGRLTEYYSWRADFLEAARAGDGERALRVSRAAAELGPHSRAVYNEAATAVQLNRPNEALLALQKTDPDVGGMKGWAQYWTQLAHANHLLGRFDEEERAASEMRHRYPERRVATVLQARALAAAGRVDDLEALLAELQVMPPRTYWSYGAALVSAGEEMMVHGEEAAGEELLLRATAWLNEALAPEPTYRPHRAWLGNAYYGLGRWEDAEAVFAGLVEDFPERDLYRGSLALAMAQRGKAREEVLQRWGPHPGYYQGTFISMDARLEIVFGNVDRGLALLSEAMRRGINDFAWLHGGGHRDLGRVMDDPRFIQLLRPVDP